MTDDKFDPDESHFSDEELEAALAGFEEFVDDSVSGVPVIPVMPIKQRTPSFSEVRFRTRMMIRLIRLPLIPAGL